jgi:patatin-like phospholipase/acyl hydrolase
MAKYRVLAIDGGGIRGLVSTILLQRLAATQGLGGLLTATDLIAGTSSGGIIALAIADCVGLQRLRELFVNRGPKVFDDSWLDDLIDLGRLRGAEYKVGPLRKEVRRIVGEKKLGQLKKNVLITSFDLDNKAPAARRTWKPKLFYNFQGAGSDREVLAYKVALYTSAAPTYFPSVDGFIDGGVYAGNPSMCALAQTQDRRYAPTPAIDDVVLFSLGSGTSLQYLAGQSHEWGYVQWVKPLISLMLDGANDIARYQCEQILRDRYHRLAPVFPKARQVKSDHVKKIDYMIEFAETLNSQTHCNTGMLRSCDGQALSSVRT